MIANFISEKKKVDFSLNIEFAIVLICNVDLIEKNEGQPASGFFVCLLVCFSPAQYLFILLKLTLSKNKVSIQMWKDG